MEHALNAVAAGPIAVDAQGDLFVPTNGSPVTSTQFSGVYGSAGDQSQILELDARASSYSIISALGISPGGGGNLVLDGSGDLFVANTPARIAYEIPAGSSTPQVIPFQEQNSNDPLIAVAVDDQGDVFQLDGSNGDVYELSPSGTLSTFSFPDFNQEGTGAELCAQANDLAVDANGDIFVAGGCLVEELVAGTTTPVALPFSGIVDASGIAVNGSGDVFVADYAGSYSGDVLGGVVELSPNDVQTTLPLSGLDEPYGIALDQSGNLYVAVTASHEVIELSAAGVQSTLPFTGLLNPAGIAVNATGNVYVLDAGLDEVLELSGGAGSSGPGSAVAPLTLSEGTSSACAALANGTVDCWGDNYYGALGDGLSTTSTIPVSVTGITTATSVSVGGQFACATLASGSVDCWGYNGYGGLGDGNTSNSTIPVDVTGITTATSVSVGGDSACATLSGGTVDCWGYNSSGQLGNGTTTNSTIPVNVAGITTATSVSVGDGFACATLSGGTIECWGGNGYGELGDGAYNQPSIPVSVTGITTATSVSAGEDSACATLANGTVQCWGDDGIGQLGNGTTTYSLDAPASVTGIATAT